MSEAYADLKRIFSADQFSHAYLFLGPGGEEKERFILELVATILCLSEDDKPCGSCRSCQLFSHGNHPDFRMIRPEGENIKLEQVQEVCRDTAFLPYLARKRVYLFIDLQRLTEVAANSFLKTLEEPPMSIVFLALAPTESAVMPTIRSRMQRIYLSFSTDGSYGCERARANAHTPSSACSRSHSSASAVASTSAPGTGPTPATASAPAPGSAPAPTPTPAPAHTQADLGSPTPLSSWMAQGITGEVPAEVMEDPTRIETFAGWHSLLALFQAAEYWEKQSRSVIDRHLYSLTEQFREGFLQDPANPGYLKIMNAIIQARGYLAANVNPRLLLEDLYLRIYEHSSGINSAGGFVVRMKTEND